MLDTEKMSLGQKLAVLRKRQSWTQNEAAERIGIHGRNLSRYETDKLFPSPRTLRRLAEVYAVDVEELQGPSVTDKIVGLADPRLLRAFQQAQRLDEDDKKVVLRIVQALLTKKKVERALGDEE